MDSTTLSFDGSEGGMGQSLGLGVAAIIGLSQSASGISRRCWLLTAERVNKQDENESLLLLSLTMESFEGLSTGQWWNKKNPKTIQFFTCFRLLGCCLFDTASSRWHRWVWTQRMSVLEPFFCRFDVFLEFLLEIDRRGTRCCSVTEQLDATLVARVTNMDVLLRDK